LHAPHVVCPSSPHMFQLVTLSQCSISYFCLQPFCTCISFFFFGFLRRDAHVFLFSPAFRWFFRPLDDGRRFAPFPFFERGPLTEEPGNFTLSSCCCTFPLDGSPSAPLRTLPLAYAFGMPVSAPIGYSFSSLQWGNVPIIPPPPPPPPLSPFFLSAQFSPRLFSSQIQLREATDFDSPITYSLPFGCGFYLCKVPPFFRPWKYTPR